MSASDELNKILEGSAVSELQRIIGKSAFGDVFKSDPIVKTGYTPLPKVEAFKLPSQAQMHSYESSGALIKRLAETVNHWKTEVSEEFQPVILAILQGGISIEVSTLSEDGFNGVRIDGKFNGNQCMVVTHQATVQMLCYLEKIEKEEDRKPIRFVY